MSKHPKRKHDEPEGSRETEACAISPPSLLPRPERFSLVVTPSDDAGPVECLAWIACAAIYLRILYSACLACVREWTEAVLLERDLLSTASLEARNMLEDARGKLGSAEFLLLALAGQVARHLPDLAGSVRVIFHPDECEARQADLTAELKTVSAAHLRRLVEQGSLTDCRPREKRKRGCPVVLKEAEIVAQWRIRKSWRPSPQEKKKAHCSAS